MSLSPSLMRVSAVATVMAALPASAFTVIFDQNDFTTVTPAFSSVSTFNLDVNVSAPLQKGALYADPTIGLIEYNVSGSLAPGTPSGFPGFVFQLSHIVTGTAGNPPPIPIAGSIFYSLNGSLTNPGPGQTLRFQVSPTANLGDGIQINELEDLGGGVVFRFNGRETGEGSNPGRYHPTWIELRSDGTGLIQNADNNGGINPATSQVVNVALGEEYITNLTFDPGALTIAIPEPSVATLGLLGGGLALLRRRRKR